MMVPQQQRRRRRRAALSRIPERRVVVARGAGGFGFTIAGQRPCVVSAVAAGGPAECAGLRAGDALMAVDGASVARAPHASVARLVASAQGPIALSVAREPPPTDTEDTEPEERARTRRRYPPPRRRLQPLVHHPACHAAPSTSGVNEILQNISRAQLTPHHVARLECRAVVGYLGTIETPQAAAAAAPASVRSAVRKLRQERRTAAPVLLTVLPAMLLLRRADGQLLAQYARERIVFAGCGSDADRRFLGLVTAAEAEESASHSCHVFAVDARAAEHAAHAARARQFRVTCTRDPVAERCLEFPPSAEYVVGVVRGMYSLPADDCAPLQPISKLVRGASPVLGPLAHRPAGRDQRRPAADSPQPSTGELTTSSNSDSGIGFHRDCRSVADRILVVDFGRPPAPVRYRREPRRPVGLVGCDFEDGSFLSNTTPVVDGFGGRGRPLNLDDVMLDTGDVRPRGVREDYNYNLYGNVASTSRAGAEGEGHYEFVPAQLDMDDVERVSEAFNSVEIYEERRRRPDYQSTESVENATVVSALSKASVDTAGTSRTSDTVSVYSTRSHEEARPALPRHLQASLDDMLVLGLRDPPEDKDEGKFVHPASVKLKVRKAKPLNIISKTRHMLSRRERALSASAGDVSAPEPHELQAAASEPDLRNQSEQGSPFRRWTTSGGAGSSYRHQDHRQLFAKQMSEGAPALSTGSSVSRWSLGLEQLLADPAGAAAFAHFLDKEFAAENIRFWRSCEQYRQSDGAARRALAADIWARHLADRAPEPVNVDAAARRAAEPGEHVEPPADLFNQAQKQIFNVMKFDSYPRFLRSGVHAECARADLRGQPPPYPPLDADATKLKKSASNASERRRSGGASLLPWRSRAASRDRAPAGPAPAPAPAPAPEPQVTDVVMSGALCRVVLPDGATSVVGVSAALPVGRLVERLLARRRLPARHYDVLLTDAAPGEPRTVPTTAPSSALGGRTAAVERRAVLRLQLGGRALLVRCRPARRLRHVLRPVLARYCPGATAKVSLDGRVVHPDTPASELDGARLVLTLDTTDVTAAPADTDDDLSDLALRLHDDDDDVSTHSSVSGVSGGSASWGLPSAPAPAPDRVRAALRPGPALHNHPPDFLENLRETQRQRLSARTPPPLPPKPPRAAPTLV